LSKIAQTLKFEESSGSELNCIAYMRCIVRTVIFSSKLKEVRNSIFFLNPCLDKIDFQELGFSSKLAEKQTKKGEKGSIF